LAQINPAETHDTVKNGRQPQSIRRGTTRLLIGKITLEVLTKFLGSRPDQDIVRIDVGKFFNHPQESAVVMMAMERNRDSIQGDDIMRRVEFGGKVHHAGPKAGMETKISTSRGTSKRKVSPKN
jgi:hypothetical protein